MIMMDMSTPPVVNPPKKSGMPLWGWGLIGCAVMVPCILAAILFPVFSSARDAAQRSASISSIKEIGLAAIIYSGDNDDRFPPSADWEEFLLPYVGSEAPYTDPNAQPKFKNKRGYAMNGGASGFKSSDLADPMNQPLFFTSLMDEVSAVGGKDDLRFESGGLATICLADGSARRVMPEAASTLLWEFKKPK